MPSLPSEVIGILDALPSSFAEGVVYAKTPIPSELDAEIEKLISYFMTAEEAAREEILDTLAQKSRFPFSFAKRMAMLAIRTNDDSKLLPAFIALVLEDLRFDPRDTMVHLFLVRHATLLVKADCEALMREAAQYARSRTAALFLKVAQQRPKRSDIREMGFKAGTSPDGFVFEQV